jgi:hypothetical protein
VESIFAAPIEPIISRAAVAAAVEGMGDNDHEWDDEQSYRADSAMRS